MPPLNWDAFTTLPGSSERNFEILCRSLIRRHYGRFGIFRAQAAQPGVEFHLQLTEDCSLGERGRWYGWQCRWYQLTSGRPIGTTRRAQIGEAIETTTRVLPDLTDWVLWTRYSLTARDQDWFFSIATKMRLHLWTGMEVEEHLSGEATIFRSTYFGELVCTPELLFEQHQEAVTSIKPRWMPEVHHVVDAERDLRQMLGESGSWDNVQSLADVLRADAKAAVESESLPPDLTMLVEMVAKAANEAVLALESIDAGIRKGDLDILRQELSVRPVTPSSDVRNAPRRLRSGNHKAALFVTNALGANRQATRLFDQIEGAFGTRLVAVLAPAGCGKTQLAAQITMKTEDRPCGVLLYGRDLHAGHTLDNLARRFLIAGQPVPSIEALLAAIDAAGRRAHHRLPLVIDGLNEAEDPREWRSLLAALQMTLEKYPYVLFICTLRPEFEDEALPPDVLRVEIPDFGQNAVEAIPQYFQYYKIDAADVLIPFNLLKHPLTMRLFCEVTNPKRDKVVGLEAMPGSLTALFDRYLEQTAKRIAELSPRIHRYYEQDVRAALDLIGAALWDGRARVLEVRELRRLLRDEARPWDQSLVRALEQEGVLLRVPGDAASSYTAPVYDALGGHLVANALLSRYGQAGLESLLKDTAIISLLAGPIEGRHPLATDIVSSMVGQFPRRLHSLQLWKMVDEPLRTVTLRLAAKLEGEYLDAVTVQAIITLARQGPRGAHDFWEKFQEARGSINHPLNSEALDEVLRPMEVADRDLRWSEWIRRRQGEVLKDLEHLEERWRCDRFRAGDILRARWVMWTLTTTVRPLRDQATRTMYWFGRFNTADLFGLTIESLGINDQYVPERMLAAAYGVAMAHQQYDAEFSTRFEKFLKELADAVVGISATQPTSHYLVRTYIRGIVSLAQKFYQQAVPDTLKDHWTFGSAPEVTSLLDQDPRSEEVKLTMYMDFRNYTIGHLFGDRRNYDMDHAGFKTAEAYVRGVVWSLGWRSAMFSELDKEIAADFSGRRINRLPIERYGKKYSRIGFFMYAGLLDEQDLLPNGNQRLADVDIDPSFPEPAPIVSVPHVSWLSPDLVDDAVWVRDGEIDVPIDLLRCESIEGHPGPWLLISGNLIAQDRVLGRKVFGLLSALVVPKSDVSRLVQALRDGAIPWLSRDVPSDYYTFAGEIPWSPEFASRNEDTIALYLEDIDFPSGTSIPIEGLAHRYAWEGNHSTLNNASGALVPSQTFSRQFDLRGCPQSFDQILPDGMHGAITLGGAGGLEGHLLYLHEDLLLEYVGDRRVVWLAWGERELWPYPSSPPAWLKEALDERAGTWRIIRIFDQSVS